jgi:hypothetical protein
MTKQIENLVEGVLQDRTNGIMVRVNDDSLRHLDMLVEVEITKSRSESAAFLIDEGRKANQSLFNKIQDIAKQITTLKTQLREAIELEDLE